MIGLCQFARKIMRVVELFAFDNVKAEQLLFCFCKRAVDDHRFGLGLAQRGRRCGGQQANHGAETTFLRDLADDLFQARHAGVVLGLRPAHDFIFV